ncbi:hypothetical protein CEK26_005471 [Fusarium fujikuroi]|uniref:Uncharacterized protein n=1 Tax=Fusarium fujikuroi TaxID=5127 RepID=A0A5Q3FM59_FUSFU|nr:hypothetical protein CEK27_005472 [Fusarium fujikuroi]QGI92402.1 hypothetical protein CEK26_005471 [Fusarium fujikuroi]SCO17158.1 related to tol protein [Fusarium fujikuroi]SCO51911.1 related to tol protein [Fusarium fujikuroi]SCV59167.1 related to tol protein [Fusarium fujikuroi]
MSVQNSRLCCFCRKLEPADQLCPSLQNQPVQAFPSGINITTKPWTRRDEALLEQLRQHPSELCQRCAEFDIIRAFNEADPLDDSQRVELEMTQYIEHAERQEPYRLRFGLLSEFYMKPSCPLCRLLIPRPPPEHDTTVLTLIPYRWHIRQDHWEGVPEDYKRMFAIWFGLSKPGLYMSEPSFFNAGQQLRVAVMTGEAIALHPTSPSEEFYNARVIDGMVDVSLIKKGLEHCQSYHSENCNAKFDKGLLITKMLDVHTRKVVDCPDNCDYLALSYVWGGIHPADGALEAGTLPQTIEDAITLTKKLGKRYLWVDALCIDQSPNPTPEQAASKAKQLQLMHLIYYCATVTIFAVAGPHSDYGIPGISKPRVGSTRERINGKDLVVVPPQIMSEIMTSVWQTRAWTWQEDVLSTRKLYLTETQWILHCNETLGPSDYAEAHDTAVDLTCTTVSGGKIKAGYAETTNTAFLDRTSSMFISAVTTYTSRSLTNDGDSLNAFQGGLARFGKLVYPQGFEWGMPLKEFPQCLAWIHDCAVKPTRRSAFPSWSWAGWGGTVQYPTDLTETATENGDLIPRMLSIDDKVVALEGWAVTLDIRTEPFSEVVIPGTNQAIGCVTERNFEHNMTLPTGKYRCFVAARLKKEVLRNGLENQLVFLIVLRGNKDVEIEERQTVITVSRLAIEGKDFMEFGPKKTVVKMK